MTHDTEPPIADVAALVAEVLSLHAQLNEMRRRYDAAAKNAVDAVDQGREMIDPLRAQLAAALRWQREVAEGLGYLNQAEGQDGYEVAAPGVIVGAFAVSLAAARREAEDRAKEIQGARFHLDELNDQSRPLPEVVESAIHALRMSDARYRREAEEVKISLAQLREQLDVSDALVQRRQREAEEATREAVTRLLHGAWMQGASRVADLERELDRLRGALGAGEAWPVADVLVRLSRAADHLLHGHSCDDHGHEEVRSCMLKAAEYAIAIRAALAPDVPLSPEGEAALARGMADAQAGRIIRPGDAGYPTALGPEPSPRTECERCKDHGEVETATWFDGAPAVDVVPCPACGGTGSKP